MKFIITSLKLLRSLQALSGVLNSNNTLPILDDFLFHLNENELKITASDLETTMIVSLIPDLAEGKGEVAIPAKILLDTMKTFPDIPVTFEINPDTMRSCISMDSSRIDFESVPWFFKSQRLIFFLWLPNEF